MSDNSEEMRQLWEQQFTAVHAIHEARVSEEVDVSKYTFVGAAASLVWVATYHQTLPVEAAVFAWFAPFVITFAGRLRFTGIQYQKYLATEYIKAYEEKFLPSQGYMTTKQVRSSEQRTFWNRSRNPGAIWTAAMIVTGVIAVAGSASAIVSPEVSHSYLWQWIGDHATKCFSGA